MGLTELFGEDFGVGGGQLADALLADVGSGFASDRCFVRDQGDELGGILGGGDEGQDAVGDEG